jgi:hypothetical protein
MIALLDSSNLVTRTLGPKLHTRLPMVGLKTFSSFEALWQDLAQRPEESVIAILAADDRCRLERFRSLLNLCIDVRLVLVLPDHKNETIHLGHRLYPRFISYRDGNFDDLVAVVARMHRVMQQNRIRGREPLVRCPRGASVLFAGPAECSAEADNLTEQDIILSGGTVKEENSGDSGRGRHYRRPVPSSPMNSH